MESAPILTLEPLLEAVREGVEEAGWTLSGLQKTTSHQFEGRWEGEATRSAYLFFHRDDIHEEVSVDVFLDETTRGLTGNLALVIELASFGDLGDVRSALSELAVLSGEWLPPDCRSPVSLRFRLPDSDDDPGKAESQARLKVRIPRATISAGEEAIRRLAVESVRAFGAILASPRLAGLMPHPDPPGVGGR